MNARSYPSSAMRRAVIEKLLIHRLARVGAGREPLVAAANGPSTIARTAVPSMPSSRAASIVAAVLAGTKAYTYRSTGIAAPPAGRSRRGVPAPRPSACARALVGSALLVGWFRSALDPGAPLQLQTDRHEAVRRPRTGVRELQLALVPLTDLLHLT